MAAESESQSMSVDTSLENPEDSLQDLTNEQLEQLLEDTLRANEVLGTETQMFEKSFKRMELKMEGSSGPGMARQTSASLSMGNVSSVGDGTGSRLGARKRSKSRTSTIDRTLRLTAEQKCEIAQRELEEYAKDVRNTNDDSERHMDDLRAKLEEADMRLGEIKKEEYEFERDIAKGAVNPRTGKANAEKVAKYLEDKLRAKEAVIVKLRLKNTALKLQRRKLEGQLKQKEEMGEVLHEVDFSQLKIENQQYIEKIDERNQELLRLKMMAGSTQQVLNSYKKKLGTLTMELDRVKTDIGARHELLSHIDDETRVVEEERRQADRVNRHLKQQLATYRVPDVMDYVHEKASLYELQRKVKSWERKVDIAGMALKAHQKTWHKMQYSRPNMMA